MKLSIQVTSEVGRLRTALVHEPGAEVDRMVPAMMEELLFDDILYGDRARDEHARFRRVLQHCGVELLDSSDLLEEALAVEGAGEWLVDVLLEDLDRAYREPLRDLSPAELRSSLVEGVRVTDESCAAVDVDELYGIPPLPNWCFQRDTQVVLGDGVVFSSMAAPARHREALLARLIFEFHPRLAGTPVIFDPLKPHVAHPLFVAPERPHLEGGDVLILSPDVIAVGLSERTNRTGIKALAAALSRREGGPRWMIVVEVPRRRAYMHLDTLITQVDRDACLVFPPVILPGGPEPARVWEIDLHAKDLARRPVGPLLDCLAAHGLDLEPISCGGSDPVRQQREQWTDGSNAIAVAPGVITLFDRNLETAAELDRHGFRVVEAEDLLLGREEIDVDSGHRVCVLISSHEISRARGGPHCLVHPLVREP
jgi:arginine deiminase